MQSNGHVGGLCMYALWIQLNKDCVLGLNKFQDKIEAILARRAKMAAQGRPQMRL